MTEIFNEVDDQIRSERAMALVTRGWPYALGAVALAALVFLGAWGWGKHQEAEAARASQTYSEGLEAIAARDERGAEAKFAEVARSAPPAYKALALMQQAGGRLRAKKDAEAVTLLDQAARADHDPVMADSAGLRAAYVLMDHGPGTDVEARLQALSAAGRPFRWLALEALAMSKLQAGRVKEARSDFSVLTLAPDVSDNARNRARAAMALIDDGTAPALPALVRAAAAAPPAPPALSSVPVPAPGALQ